MANPWMDFACLCEQANFAAVLAHYSIAVPHRQGQVTVNCPFHEDRRPSLSVSLARNLFHCFACQAKGDILDFVARIEGVSLPEAARLIAAWCDIQPTSWRPRPWPAKQTPDQHEPCSSGARCQNGHRGTDDLSPRPPDALDSTHPYLFQRGLTPHLIETFGLGYCKQGRLHGRVCIPIHSLDGKDIVAFAGRWAHDRVPDGTPRYLMPRGFRKSAVLFNYHRAVPAQHLVIVEGFWSVFRLHALQIPAVALMGTTLSDAPLDLLRRSGARRLTLLLDGDEAGRKATATFLPRLTSQLFVHAPTLPEDQSPDTVPEKILLEAVRS